VNPTTSRVIIVTLGSLAAILVGISVWQQLTSASNRTPNSIAIDFSAYPDSDPIQVNKGTTVVVSIMIESSRDADYTVTLLVRAERVMFNSSRDHTSEGITVGLDKQSVVLSPRDDLTTLSANRVERESGALLTVTATSDAIEGNYNYLLEANRESTDGRGSGSGKLFTITVT
jgi:hypothetical protein